MNKVLAIIPARGGSKGVPGKNIRLVAGKPLIKWAIESAQASELVTDFYVSTDDKDIADVAMACGAKVLMRPVSLAEDKTPMIPAVQHALLQAEEINGKYDTFILLQPTAPQRTGSDIDEALKLLEVAGDGKADSIVSVYLVDDAHPSRMYTQDSGFLIKYAVEPKGALRQDLEDVYHRNGAIYACNRDLLMDEGLLIGERCASYIMPKDRSGNIDDMLDLHVTDLMLRLQYNLEK